MLKNILFVFLGGGFGCTSRYTITLLLSKYKENLSGFPIHTITANFLGCLCIGLIIGYLSRNPNNTLNLLLVTGFCGGFTTFSTFSSEILKLFQGGQVGMGLLYMGLSLAVCLAATLVGTIISR